MPQAQINLIKGDRVGVETDYRDALPVNMYAVLRPILGAAGYMSQEPGLSLFATGIGVDRGGIWNERLSKHLRVSGGSLVSVSDIGTLVTIGAISGTQLASLPYSFNTQAIITDGKMWLYNGTALTQVTDPNLGAPIDGVWVDGYYFLTDGEYIYHTDISNEASIDPLKFATAEFMPDKSLGVAKTSDNKVMVFGRYSTELFINAATPNFAFQRVESRALKIGIVGTHAKTEAEDSFYILGGRKGENISVHRLGVGSSEKIATREVDKVIGQYSETDLAQSKLETFSEDGNSFVLVHLPGECLKFNLTIAKVGGIEAAWSILRTGTGTDAWRGINGVFDPRIGHWTFGDKIGNQIGKLDSTVATQYGEIAEWELHTPFFMLDGMSINELNLETIPGHTATRDAKVFISATRDGLTHSNEWAEMYGLPNDYGKRFVVRRLGYVSDWVGLKLRGATRSRMAFARCMVDYG